MRREIKMKVKVDSTKFETLYDFFKSMKMKEFGFEVRCKNIDTCCWGSQSDIDDLLFESLNLYKWSDVETIDKRFSNITHTQWFTITLKFENVEELLAVFKSRRLVLKDEM
jgi:hypothetical protein